MKTYFVISDIHSFYVPMKQALDEAGYQKSNTNHILVVCGDCWDRGPDAVKVFEFLKSIPRSRRILIRGNHEELLLDLLKSDMPHRHDYSNGTVSTICQFTGYDEYDIRFGCAGENIDWNTRMEFGRSVWNMAKEDFKNLPIYKFLIDKKNWVDYYEIDKYIMVHSFIPTQLKEDCQQYSVWPRYELNPQVLQYMEDWRIKATDLDWSDAKWGCPWKLFQSGLFKQETEKGKVLVVGHWHTSHFYENLDHVTKNIDHCPLYNNHGLIGLDACTVATDRCNVFKFDLEE